jgi:hypothetical protein
MRKQSLITIPYQGPVRRRFSALMLGLSMAMVPCVATIAQVTPIKSHTITTAVQPANQLTALAGKAPPVMVSKPLSIQNHVAVAPVLPANNTTTLAKKPGPVVAPGSTQNHFTDTAAGRAVAPNWRTQPIQNPLGGAGAALNGCPPGQAVSSWGICSPAPPVPSGMPP